MVCLISFLLFANEFDGSRFWMLRCVLAMNSDEAATIHGSTMCLLLPFLSWYWCVDLSNLVHYESINEFRGVNDRKQSETFTLLTSCRRAFETGNMYNIVHRTSVKKCTYYSVTLRPPHIFYTAALKCASFSEQAGARHLKSHAGAAVASGPPWILISRQRTYF